MDPDAAWKMLIEALKEFRPTRQTNMPGKWPFVPSITWAVG